MARKTATTKAPAPKPAQLPSEPAGDGLDAQGTALEPRTVARLTLDPKTNEFRAPDRGSLSLEQVLIILLAVALVIVAIKVF